TGQVWTALIPPWMARARAAGTSASAAAFPLSGVRAPALQPHDARTARGGHSTSRHEDSGLEGARLPDDVFVGVAGNAREHGSRRRRSAPRHALAPPSP